MGEVYRATDTNLARQVAIKVLPAAVAADAARLARFDREAKTLAALNHPNIAAIYGLEKSAGTTALVMELVEGPTLADRIGERPDSHRRGTADREADCRGDRGCPRAGHHSSRPEACKHQGSRRRHREGPRLRARQGDGPVAAPGDFGNSSTITSPAMTQEGTILGTAAYMSPEQARGRPVDRRADIWAFGCILYEMVTGRRVFTGEGGSRHDRGRAARRGGLDATASGRVAGPPHVPAALLE